MGQPRIVSRDEWLAARKQFLSKEKKLTQLRDRLSVERRALPWVRVDKPYVFEGPQGRETLSELFAGRSQLVIYHFMFGPGWEQGCPSCSWAADNIEANVVHLRARDVTLVVVSRAPLAQIQAFQRRMGWRFPWVSSYGSDFNYDYRVSFTPEETATGKAYYNYGPNGFPSEEAPGVSVFSKDASGAVFHTYSTFARGAEPLLGGYYLLDLVPKGRDETGPWTMSWVRHHDRYEQP